MVHLWVDQATQPHLKTQFQLAKRPVLMGIPRGSRGDPGSSGAQGRGFRRSQSNRGSPGRDKGTMSSFDHFLTPGACCSAKANLFSMTFSETGLTPKSRPGGSRGSSTLQTLCHTPNLAPHARKVLPISNSRQRPKYSSWRRPVGE